MQCCGTPLPTCEEEPSYNIHVFWWQLLDNKKTHTFAYRYSMLPYSRSFEVHTYYCGCWLSPESQEAQGLLDDVQQQPRAFVLSGPAIVITNVATASALLAEGWSTESMSRVVRTARTSKENNEKGRAEHAYCSHMHDEVTISDTFPATVQGLDEGKHLAENTIREDDQEDETEQSLTNSLQTREFMRTSNRTLVQVLRLGGAKRRIILAAAKHSCGACEAQKRPAGPIIVSRSPNSFVFNVVVGLEPVFS